MNNTLYNGALGAEAGIWSSSGAPSTGTVFLNNIIEGWGGTGGVPIELTAAGSETAAIVAGNIYAKNATNAPSWGGQPPIIEVDNIDNGTTSVLTSPGTGDFRPTDDAKEKGFHQVFRGIATTVNPTDSGAAQILVTGGGGSALPRALMG